MRWRIVAVAVISIAAFGAPAAHASVIQMTPNNIGLVGYWSFNEGTSTIAHDFSGNGNNGTLSGSTLPTWVAGKLGKALSFDGSSDKVTGGSITVGTNMTISAWINKTSSTFQKSFFSNRGGVGTLYFGLDGTKIFLYDNGAFKSDAGAVQIGQWQHIVATSNGSVTTFYVNGVFATSTNQARSGSTGTFGIGWDPNLGTEFWDGAIDEVRIYNRALTATEVAGLYQSGAAKINSSQSPGTLANGLVGWWTMDGADTVWSSPTAATEADRSGNGNTGTLIGMTQSGSPTVGKIGQALQFDGVASSLNLGTSITPSLPLTVSFWGKVDPASAANLSIQFDSSQGAYAGFSVYLDTGGGVDSQLGSALGNCAPNFRSSYDTTNSFSMNQWHHVVVVFNAMTNQQIYVDGQLQGTTNSGTASSFGYQAGASLKIGGVPIPDAVSLLMAKEWSMTCASTIARSRRARCSSSTALARGRTSTPPPPISKTVRRSKTA